MTVDKKSWGYRRNTTIDEFLTMDDLTSILASVVRFVEICQIRHFFCFFLLEVCLVLDVNNAHLRYTHWNGTQDPNRDMEALRNI